MMSYMIFFPGYLYDTLLINESKEINIKPIQPAIKPAAFSIYLAGIE